MGNISFQAFTNFNDALMFAHGQRRGSVMWEEYTEKRHQLTHRGKAYLRLVNEHSLDRYQYPYCVMWYE